MPIVPSSPKVNKEPTGNSSGEVGKATSPDTIKPNQPEVPTPKTAEIKPEELKIAEPKIQPPIQETPSKTPSVIEKQEETAPITPAKTTQEISATPQETPPITPTDKVIEEGRPPTEIEERIGVAAEENQKSTASSPPSSEAVESQENKGWWPSFTAWISGKKKESSQPTLDNTKIEQK